MNGTVFIVLYVLLHQKKKLLCLFQCFYYLHPSFSCPLNLSLAPSFYVYRWEDVYVSLPPPHTPLLQVSFSIANSSHGSTIPLSNLF